LICDNQPLSGQGANINFNSLNNIIRAFPGINFVSTNKNIEKQNNVTYFDEISLNNFTLNEISYLSTFCKVIIGKCSGPHSFCMVDENYKDKNKYFISFCDFNDYDFGINSIPNIEKCKFINFNTYNDIAEKTIKEIINI
jgi:hypothetical protein